jgi:signal transduction histidine kinase
MRAALFLLLSSALPPAAAAQPAPTLAAFARTVETTKKAMMADPEHALVSAIAAVAMAERLPPSHDAEIAVATARWLHGESLLFTNRLTEAEPIVTATLRRVERIAPNTKLHGDLLRSYGEIAASGGRVMDALKAYQRAHEVFRRAGQARSQAMALQDIGTIFWEARDYARVLDYYRQSAEVFSDDPTLTLTMHNNRAEVFREQKRYAEASAAYRAALVEAVELRSPLLQTRILTNLAGSEAEAGRLRSAQNAVDRADALAAHGEASGWKPFIYGMAARIAIDRGDSAAAERLITRTFVGVDLQHSELLFRAYHQIAARIFEARGKQALALAHLKAFQRLDREAQTLTASAASQLLAARFDFTNQNLKISTLKQGQLQRDIEIERQRSRYRTNLFGGVLVAGLLVVGLLLLGFFSLRRSRNKVRDANITLSEVNGALEKALKAKTEFLATTSHEIRTPLNGILGMTQVLLADRRVAADVRERIEVVHGAGETMRALVDDILDVAKMENGKLTVVQEPTDLQPILRDVARLWSGQAEAKGLSLAVDISAAPQRIVSDGGRLRQIVFNLMSNATKFTASGQVTLRAAAETGADGAEVLAITVSDTGIGIADGELDGIFEAFRQVDGGTTRQFGGTGLGLAICRNLARALGGDIAVSSIVGEGTTFELRLPLVRAEAEAQTAQSDAGALEHASLLIVAGVPAVQGMLRMLLAAEVETTDAAACVEEAEERLATGGVDHVLVDVGSVAGGVEGLRRIVAASNGARVSLLAAQDAQPSFPDLVLAGADQILLKPIGADDLIRALAGLYRERPQPVRAAA